MSTPTRDKYGYAVFEEDHDTWPRCGYDRKHTKLRVRLVDRADQAAQMEISIEEVKGNRLYTHSASLGFTVEELQFLRETLDPHHADLLAALRALTTQAVSVIEGRPWNVLGVAVNNAKEVLAKVESVSPT